MSSRGQTGLIGTIKRALEDVEMGKQYTDRQVAAYFCRAFVSIQTYNEKCTEILTDEKYLEKRCWINAIL